MWFIMEVLVNNIRRGTGYPVILTR